MERESHVSQRAKVSFGWDVGAMGQNADGLSNVKCIIMPVIVRMG